jgi:hypothetical protein
MAKVLTEYLRVFAGDFNLNFDRFDSLVRRKAGDNLRFVQ